MIDASVRYVNAQGRSFVLQGDDLTFIDIRPLQAFEWSYELTNRLGGGGVAEGFARFPRTVDLTVRLRGRTRADFIARVNDLHAVADADAVAETPGRLYVGSQYMGCYLAVAGSVETEPRTGNFATLPVTVLAVEPWWCTEVTTTVNPSSAQADTTGKKYDLRYAYRYGTAIGSTRIYNNHYAPAPVRLTVYGPAVNPSVAIAGNVYAVQVSLTASQRLEIDPVARTIRIIGSLGEAVSVFDLRDKAHDIFAPVPAGESTLIYSGEYALTVTLIQQRSQLKWTQ